MPKAEAIIVFSHLRWDFVYQRPQHLLSRLAKGRPVHFIEEPILSKEGSRWEVSTPADSVKVYRPHIPVEGTPFGVEQMPSLKRLLAELVRNEKLTDYIVWLYTPMALPLAKLLQPKAVVYDCMDELSAFLSAPPELLEREAALLEWADVVFTGGPSLYRAKLGRHDNLYCFPSSVDASHFRKALTAPEAQDQAPLPHPRLGFFGVIDERLDPDILEALATAHHDWQIVMLGPIVKIDPLALPKHPNLRFIGQRSYAELPSYLAGWDVCLLPFALNEATRFISPTKTLEYMAAERPIVSTPITDVVEPYGSIVYLGETAQDFVRACEKALTASEKERDKRLMAMRQVLSSTSWDATAQAMAEVIGNAIRSRGETKEAATAGIL